MGRPPKRPEDKRQIVTFRLDPDIRTAMERAAKASGRSLSAEIEARIIATIEYDEPGLSLLASIGREIRTVLRITKSTRWHTTLKPWAAVREMLYRGPIEARRPESWESDDVAMEAYRKFTALDDQRREVLRQLAALGITLPENPPAMPKIFSGLFTPEQSGRGFARATILSAEPSEDRDRALSLLDELDLLDREVPAARQAWSEQIKLFRDAEAEGVAIYRTHLIETAQAQERAGEPFNVAYRWGMFT